MTPSSRIPFGGRPASELTREQNLAREAWMLAEANRIVEELRRNQPARERVHRNDVPTPALTPESADRMRVQSIAAQLTRALAERDRGNHLR